MKNLKLTFIFCLAFFIAACGSAAEPAKPDAAPGNTTAEKKDVAAKKDDAAAGSDEIRAATPTEATKSFIRAYAAKDIGTMKKLFSKQTLADIEKDAKDQNKSVDDMLKEFTETPLPFKDDPVIRNEKIEGDKATLEVQTFEKDEEKWEKTNLVKEDGIWKLDFGGPN
jgi:predicted lipid-binding transport protein (Tim44 family)